jgi:hypothetical protein
MFTEMLNLLDTVKKMQANIPFNIKNILKRAIPFFSTIFPHSLEEILPENASSMYNKIRVVVCINNPLLENMPIF